MRDIMLLAGWCAVAGCLGPGTGPPDQNGPDRPLPQYRVNGDVYDSLTGMPIPNLDLRVGATRLHTDAFGRFSADVDSGFVSFRVFSTDYEPIHAVFPHSARQFITLRLRRYAPWLVGFQVVGDSVEGHVVDVQGRKTIDRWLVSRAIVHRGTATQTVLGTGMNWKAQDEFGYRATLAAPGADRITWNVHDVNGFYFEAECVIGTTCVVLRSGFAEGGS